MKGNFIKTIFIVFIVIILIGTIYLSFFKKEKPEEVGEFHPTNHPQTIVANNIRIGMIEFDNMNPILSNNKNVQDISRLLFDPLFTLTEDFQLQPALATEYSMLDEKTYLIKLRENVKWQDGNLLDTSDVIFTIDMLKKEENHSVYSHNVENIIEVEKIDESIVKITLNEAVPYFEYNLIFPIVSSKYFNEENFRLESTNLKPVGTGMFYVADYANDTILLKKNENAWNKQTMKLDEISLKLYDSLSSALNAFKTEEIDMFTTSNRRIDDYLKNINYQKQTYINRNYDYLVLNCKNAVLENQEVRKAIHSAINKEEIIKEVYDNQYKRSNFPLDFGSYAYDANNSTIVFDENTAKRLLMDQGWKYTSKKWRRTVKHKYLTLELKLLVSKDNGNLVKVAKKIKDQLERVGIRVTVNEATSKQYDTAIKNKQYDMVLISSHYSYSPSLNKYFQENNAANYENEEMKNLKNQMEDLKDKNELKQIVSKMVEIYNEEVPYISLYYNTNTMLYTPHLKGSIKPNSYNLFYGIETWYRQYD